MKNLFKVAAIALCIVLMGNFAKAQTKIGYIAVDQIIPLLPEYKTAQTTVTNFQQTYIDAIQKLGTEYQNKAKDYEAKRATMSEAARTVAESELGDLQKRTTDLQNKAQQDVAAKGDEQMQPLVAKVKAAITAVAKEKGYTYVINTSSTDLIVAPEADNLLAAVKLKLALK
ncbi:MAG: OmpH family outer membrane protein [Mucilaginibacter sp.]